MSLVTKQWGIWKPQSAESNVSSEVSTLYYPTNFLQKVFVFHPTIQTSHAGTVYPVYWFAQEVTLTSVKLYKTNMHWIALGV